MVALVQVFVDVMGALLTFVITYLIPDEVADVTILHVAIWTPVTIGLAGMVIGFVKKMWGRR
ncbi:hypothetical protein [Candidatus Chloroploca asiatica]|uniref:Uncharacterized protein n=1 Tax=Candidatus Chloroploca asiatica TaxID=1506545 RepID=A0A2H3LBM3_9CHLR|nr:hypothetical protein [Candidatus Chloroploca asiatica]PDW00978.1 hypothetical protein A9Q02_21350 [Candidatus Chloroploca asiatica]